VIHKAGTTL